MNNYSKIRIFGKSFLLTMMILLAVGCQKDDNDQQIKDQTNDGLSISTLDYDDQNVLRNFSFRYKEPNSNRLVKMESSLDEDG